MDFCVIVALCRVRLDCCAEAFSDGTERGVAPHAAVAPREGLFAVVLCCVHGFWFGLAEAVAPLTFKKKLPVLFRGLAHGLVVVVHGLGFPHAADFEVWYDAWWDVLKTVFFAVVAAVGALILKGESSEIGQRDAVALGDGQGNAAQRQVDGGVDVVHVARVAEQALLDEFCQCFSCHNC